MRIAVTGASGFAGSHIATRLADAGHDVIGIGRRPSGWNHEHGEYLRADLTDAAFEPLNVDAVVNAAATTDEQAPLPVALRLNRDIPASLPHRFPGARIVHLSSSSVADVNAPRIGMREDARPATRWVGTYPASKAAGDRALTGTGAVILRPHAIYGPGDQTLLPRLERFARIGVLPLPDGGTSLHTLTRVESFAEAVALVIDREPDPGVYHVADSTAVELGAALKEAMAIRLAGKRVRIISVPGHLAWRMATGGVRIGRDFARISGRDGEAARSVLGDLSPSAVEMLGRDCVLDTTKAQSAFGFEPAATSFAGAETW